MKSIIILILCLGLIYNSAYASRTGYSLEKIKCDICERRSLKSMERGWFVMNPYKGGGIIDEHHICPICLISNDKKINA